MLKKMLIKIKKSKKKYEIIGFGKKKLILWKIKVKIKFEIRYFF
jgi:hypothetical protein